MSIELTPEQIELGAKLTPLQRNFVLNLVNDGTTQRKAYVKAGGKAKGENSQDQSASKMISNAKVALFHQSLIKAVSNKAILSREEALILLTTNARDKEIAHKDQHQAIKQLSALEGWEAPKQTELSGEVAISNITRTIID